MFEPQKTTDQTYMRDVFMETRAVLLDFHDNESASCRQMGPLLAEMADHYRSDLKVCQVNARENPALAKAYKVKSVPTLVLVHRGREVGRRTGAGARFELLSWVSQTLQGRVA